MDFSEERGSYRSRLIKEMDCVVSSCVGGCAPDFFEPPVVVGCSVPGGGAFREGVSGEGRWKLREGDEGVFGFNDLAPLLPVEVPLGTLTHTAVTSVRGKVRGGNLGPLDQIGATEPAQVRLFSPVPRDSVYDKVFQGGG